MKLKYSYIFNSMEPLGILVRFVNFVVAKIHGLICPLRVGKIIDNVESEMNKLVSNRDVVLERVGATPETEEVSDVILRWLEVVGIVMKEVDNLKRTELETPNDDCSLAWVLCAHANRYRAYDEMLKRIMALNMNSKYEPFSTPIPALEYFSSGNFVCFESTSVASEQLLEALKVDNCYVIGLYGKRGSGKTKLVKAVGEKAKYLKIFDAVLFATASQNPNVIRTIQDGIADSLNLRFSRNTEAGRALTISLSLELRSDRILVVLDDVRAKFDLEDIGIPCNNNRCKVLLTTRGQRELNCQREIPLGPLSQKEAWTLLKNHLGIYDDDGSSYSLDLLNVAYEVANECEGLPGTIIDVGSSLKSRPIEEWIATRDSLRHSNDQWQIFLSFRGEDTRHSFTGFLYQALCQGGFKTFMDDGGLNTGDQISPSLINAIEASRLSIIVLSENYASSSWCLDELVKILECVKLNKQLVWPIFYKVEPSDIRYLRNSYGKAMAEHENKFGNDSESVKKWRSALFEVSNLSGKAYTAGYEYEFIRKIVEDAYNIKYRLYI